MKDSAGSFGAKLPDALSNIQAWVRKKIKKGLASERGLC